MSRTYFFFFGEDSSFKHTVYVAKDDFCVVLAFSIRCETIHQEAAIYNVYQRYDITKEYLNRPILPPPFIIFTHIYRMVRCFLHYLKSDRFSWYSEVIGRFILTLLNYIIGTLTLKR